MSYIHITGCQLVCSPSAFPAQALQLNKASPYISTVRTRLPTISLKLNTATYKYQHAGPVCLFGEKGKSESGNEGSPWKSLEKAMGNLKKDQSIEEILKQQIQKQEYYDDEGSGGKPPGGGGGDGYGGSGEGEGEEEGLAGMLSEFGNVMMGTLGFIFLYIYMIEAEQITVTIRDFIRFLFTRKKSIRLSRLLDKWNRFFERMTEKEEYDPDWLERAILNTPTMYDHPAKYKLIIKSLLESPPYG